VSISIIGIVNFPLISVKLFLEYMHIGYAGPVSLDLLNFDWKQFGAIPTGYPFPMAAFFVNGLMKKGHNVTVFTTSEGLDIPVTLKSDKLSICIARREAHAARDFFSSEREGLIELMSRNPVDILNAHWTYEFALAGLKMPVPVVITVHDYALKILYYKFREKPGFNEFMHWVVRFLMNNKTLRKGKHFVAVSEYLYNTLSQRKKNKSVIINDFFDEESSELKYEPRTKDNYIVSVCNGFGYTKNIQNAIIAFSIFRKKNKDIRYHLIGTGMEPDGPACQFAKKNDLLDGIDFMGFLSYDMAVKENAGSLVNLHSSREESFGMSVLESQIFGTVVIGGLKSGNIPYLLEHGEAGILCNIEDPNDIAAKLEICVKDDKLRNRIEDYARSRAYEKFSSSIIIDKYITLFLNILKQES